VNPLRCHDIFPAQVPQPNYRALRRILAAFIGCAVLSLGVCIAMLIHDAGERPQVGRKRLAVGPPLVTPVSAAPALAFGGAWTGTAALIDRGICDLRFEIAEEKPGRFTGYTSFACTIAEPLMSKPHHADLRTEVLSRYTPDAAYLPVFWRTARFDSMPFIASEPISPAAWYRCLLSQDSAPTNSPRSGRTAEAVRCFCREQEVNDHAKQIFRAGNVHNQPGQSHA
jgi:hypothetical protein